MKDIYLMKGGQQINNKAGKYKYWGFGLHILSDIEFVELLTAEFDESDVEIKIARVPEIKTEKVFDQAGMKYLLTDEQFVLEVSDVGRFMAQNGNAILVEPGQALTETRSMRLFVLASVFAAILIQRKQLPLHASAILHKNELILLCGDSGAGKSTTLSGLIKNNHTIFSDDVVVMNSDGKATASYPMIKLWEDAQEKLAHNDFDDRSFAIKPGMNKYGIFFHDKFDTNSYPVKKILILKKDDVVHIDSRRVVAADAFAVLSKQVYRPMLIHNNQLRALTFTIISTLVNSSVIYQITRPINCDVNKLVKCVEELICNEE